ncbi:MAG: hypothetical protein CM15mP3_04910 [Candidatus Poseidoniales archaeon]|nr:MAG: hypothetical protein CM15mP3_04910 [Candidatus Poseidoniales archaeon]
MIIVDAKRVAAGGNQADKCSEITSQITASGGYDMLTNFENSHDHSKKFVNFPFIKQAINGDYDFTSSGKNEDYLKNLTKQIEHFIQAQKITKPLIQPEMAS